MARLLVKLRGQRIDWCTTAANTTRLWRIVCKCGTEPPEAKTAHRGRAHDVPIPPPSSASPLAQAAQILSCMRTRKASSGRNSSDSKQGNCSTQGSSTAHSNAGRDCATWFIFGPVLPKRENGNPQADVRGERVTPLRDRNREGSNRSTGHRDHQQGKKGEDDRQRAKYRSRRHPLDNEDRLFD
ncbi:hypothetical protein PENSPDRAFT_663467 [Peniophora sp. CONT]|nr:hypothetical protein PENSPDRAFT_663467 [Peniophora sp. CONT]